MIDLVLYSLLLIGPPLLAILVTNITAGPHLRTATHDHTPSSACIFRDRPPLPWLPEQPVGSRSR